MPEEDTTESGGGPPAGGSGKNAVMFSASLSIENTRKYGFDATAATTVTAKLVAIPPPSAFLAAIQGTES